MNKNNLIQVETIVKTPKLTILNTLIEMIDAEDKVVRGELSGLVLDALEELEQQLKIQKQS